MSFTLDSCNAAVAQQGAESHLHPRLNTWQTHYAACVCDINTQRYKVTHTQRPCFHTSLPFPGMCVPVSARVRVCFCVCVCVMTAPISGWERLAQQFNNTISNPLLQFDLSCDSSLYNPCYYHQVHYEVKAYNRLCSELPSLGCVINSQLKSSFEWIFYLSEHIIRYSGQAALKKTQL